MRLIGSDPGCQRSEIEISASATGNVKAIYRMGYRSRCMCSQLFKTLISV
jgi:hypothetical protein